MQPGSNTPQVIDCHAHAVPIGLLEQLSDGAGREGVSAHQVEGGWHVTIPGQDERLVRPKMFRGELRSDWCDEQGIDRQLLLPWVDLQPTAAMDNAAARDWARRINGALLKEAAHAGGDAPVLATVALGDGDQAAEDLVGAVRGEGLAGLILSTNPVHCTDLTDRRLDPLWASAAELGVPVLLHPSSDGPARELPGSERFGNAYCRLVDTSFAVAKLILSGVLDRHPDLRLVTVHGGGFLPYQSLRLDGAHRADELAAYEVERGTPSAYLGDLYYDTVAMPPAAIRFLAETVGARHVLLGSDYPFPIGDPTPVSSVRAAGLAEGDTAAVLGGNVADLLTGSKSA
jgi:aminocarboxymuconate-semialdehyde decarboxylase